MGNKKIYELKKECLITYKLEVNYAKVSSAKKEYIESTPANRLMYEIISKNKESWFTDNIVVPISQINYVSLGGESILKPKEKISPMERGLLDIYIGNELYNPQFLNVMNNKMSCNLYYFILLSEKYKNKYKTNHHTNILSVPKDLFMLELLINDLYEKVDLDNVDLKPYIDLISTGIYGFNDLARLLEEDMYSDLLKRAETTTKLVHKINV